MLAGSWRADHAVDTEARSAQGEEEPLQRLLPFGQAAVGTLSEGSGLFHLVSERWAHVCCLEGVRSEEPTLVRVPTKDSWQDRGELSAGAAPTRSTSLLDEGLWPSSAG